MEIQINIADKVAQVIGTPIIVCGNSDYTVRFTFDEEWLDKASKTARFVYIRNGLTQYDDVIFTGSTVAVPVVSDISVLKVGVYAGDLQTTTPAQVPCIRSILCGGGTHVDPTPDVYTQLIKMIEDSAVHTPVTLAVEERNEGGAFSFWIGTAAEYEAIPEEDIVHDCFYIIEDDTTLDDIDKKFAKQDKKFAEQDKKFAKLEPFYTPPTYTLVTTHEQAGTVVYNKALDPGLYLLKISNQPDMALDVSVLFDTSAGLSASFLFYIDSTKEWAMAAVQSLPTDNNKVNLKVVVDPLVYKQGYPGTPPTAVIMAAPFGFTHTEG